MKNRIIEAETGPLASRREAARGGLALVLGLALAFAMLAAPPRAGSQEAQRVAQAPDSEPGEAEPEPPAKPQRPATSGIEEIVVRGAESEATSDFGAGDSVTGFGAEDLAALGAQDISDLASFTPNLEIVTAGATTPTFFIRGVGLNDFNANSTGAVAIYRDDVATNSPALQLGALYDIEAVNILRGPQGTGPARNASAGAIKMYARKPTGQFGGFLRSELGNYNSRDFEGAIEAPLFEDLLAGRFAFRFSERDGTMKNRCGNATPYDLRVETPDGDTLDALGKTVTDPPWSQCGEPVNIGTTSTIAEGLPTRVNDIGNWAARGTLLAQPTLDMSWLFSAHGARRDEWTRLGQSYGTFGFTCKDGDVEYNCYPPRVGVCSAPPERVGDTCGRNRDCNYPAGPPGFGTGVCEIENTRIQNVLGGGQGVQGGTGADYVAPEVRERLAELADCYRAYENHPAGTGCDLPAGRKDADTAKRTVAEELVHLDSEPWAGDFDMCSPKIEDGEYVYRDPTGRRCKDDKGRTWMDTWGGYLKGDIVLPWGIQLTTVSGYDTYDRLIDIDLDFSPEKLFHIRTEDNGWQAVQDVRLQGQLGDESMLSWDVGGWFLRENLDVDVLNDLELEFAGTGRRQYTQDVFSAAGYLSLAFDFWDHFTLDGGIRYNWERKKLDYLLTSNLGTGGSDQYPVKLEDTWQAPTGTVRLTYRFREDTHVFWKYTRGWKPGTYNATSGIHPDFGTNDSIPQISVAKPETIDAFETGVRGSWFEGRLGLDLSWFYYAYQNYQLFTAQQFAGGQPEFVILNAPSAEVYGAEVDAVARPWNGAFLNLRLGWLESQFLDFVVIQQERVYVDNEFRILNKELQNTGNALLNSPRFKLSITAEQTLPLGPWGEVSARYDGVWTDTTYYDATEGKGLPNTSNQVWTPKDAIGQPAYWVHNLRLAYRPPGLRVEVAAWVRNLTNEAYKTFAFDGSTFNQTTIYFVGDPRTYGGSLVVNF